MTPAAALIAAITAITTTVIAQSDLKVSTLQFPKATRVVSAYCADLDLDGRTDLVITTETDGHRELRTLLRRPIPPCFAGEPTVLRIDKDVVAFAFVDVLTRKGCELVVFTPERAVAMLPGENDTPIFESLFAHRILWPAANKNALATMQSMVRDLDGDGLADFAVPEPDGARILLQRRSENGTTFVVNGTITLPAFRQPLAGKLGRSSMLSAQNKLGLAIVDDEPSSQIDPATRDPLLQIRTRSAPFHFADFDGDQRLDGIALRNEQLWLWRQESAGTFAPLATSLPLPLPEDRLSLFDPAFDVQFADLDLDGRSDLLVTTSAQRNDEIETRIDLYRQRAEHGPWPAMADSRLRLQTLAGAPQIVDADGDGKQDLVALTLRTDLLRGLDGTAKGIEVQLNIFRGDGNRFTLPALITKQLQLPAIGGPSDPLVVQVLAGKNGAPGALLLRTGDALQMRPLRRDGKRLLLDEPAWQHPISSKARLRTIAGEPGELLVLEDHELQHVRCQ
jgi:hypothetical protein